MTPQRAPIELKAGDKVKIRGYSMHGSDDDGLIGTIFQHGRSREEHYVKLKDGTRCFKRSQLIKLKPKKKPVVVEFKCTWAGDAHTLPHPYECDIEIIRSLVGKRTRVRVEVLDE